MRPRPADSERPDRADDADEADGPDGIRLQKVLASAGVASRRKAEELIRSGRVKVDGIVVKEMGTRIDPDEAVVHVDGNRVVLRADQVYLALNKMPGMLSTMSDELGRPNIGQLLEDRPERLFHVGRLDMDSEGLLLLTNDGDLAHRLTHPSYGVPKTYMAEIPGPGSARPRPAAAGRRRTGGRPGQGRLLRGGRRAQRPRRGGGRAARGPQAHRAAAAGRGRPPGVPAGPDPDRRRAARAISGRARCAS